MRWSPGAGGDLPAVRRHRALRPAATTGVPGLFVAGAWCDTGWPATMEGAVRSGNAAGRRAAEAVGASATAGATRSVEPWGLHLGSPPSRATVESPRRPHGDAPART